MKSPFPGMDPYIEERGLFEDFHDDLISEIKHALADVLPARYVVRTAERPYVVIAETEGKDEHVFKPDVGVVSSSNPETANVGVALAEPASETESVSMRAFIATEFRETFIEIYLNEPERILVTCIEVLSPSNKRRDTEGWEVYLRKRQGLLLGAANLVEIDLLRGGERFPMLDPWPNSPYTLLVSRRARSAYCRAWPAHFRLPLPTIPVPLLSPDADLPLTLQPMIDAVYCRSRYHRDIDYTRPLTPPLTAEDSAWLAEQLRQQGAPTT
jgi:hypothetical protein